MKYSKWEVGSEKESNISLQSEANQRSHIQHLTSKHGFTLVELITVIAIIGMLAAVAVYTFPQARKQARDQQRKSDLRQYQAALEAYANANGGNFPSMPGDPAPALCTTSIDLDGKGFIALCPEDPFFTVATQKYRYDSDGAGGGGVATKYVVYATLESPSSTTYWVICSIGKGGNSTSTPSSGNCPI